MIHTHIADALKSPHLIRLSDGMVLARFESMKIYSALAAVRRLLDRGTVRPGQTLVDSSSGIYAQALACPRAPPTSPPPGRRAGSPANSTW